MRQRTRRSTRVGRSESVTSCVHYSKTFARRLAVDVDVEKTIRLKIDQREALTIALCLFHVGTGEVHRGALVKLFGDHGIPYTTGRELSATMGANLLDVLQGEDRL